MHQIAEIKAGALNPALHGTKAVELVFGVCRNHDSDDTVDQLTNCAMMAEFALRYWGEWTQQEYRNAVLAQNPVTLAAADNALPGAVAAEACLLVELPGHKTSRSFATLRLTDGAAPTHGMGSSIFLRS